MSLSSHINEKANLIWAIADKLTGVYAGDTENSDRYHFSYIRTINHFTESPGEKSPGFCFHSRLRARSGRVLTRPRRVIHCAPVRFPSKKGRDKTRPLVGVKGIVLACGLGQGAL